MKMNIINSETFSCVINIMSHGCLFLACQLCLMRISSPNLFLCICGDTVYSYLYQSGPIEAFYVKKFAFLCRWLYVTEEDIKNLPCFQVSIFASF